MMSSNFRINKSDPCFGNNFILFGTIKYFKYLLKANKPLKNHYLPIRLYDYSKLYLAEVLMNWKMENRHCIPFIEVCAQKDDVLYKHIGHSNKIRLFFLNKKNIKIFNVNSVNFFHKCHHSKKLTPGVRFYLKKASPKKLNPHVGYLISKALFDLIVKKQAKL